MCSILVTSFFSNSIPSPQLTPLLHSLELNLRPPLLFSWNFVEVVFHLNILMLTSISSLSLSFYQYNSIFTPGCLLPSGRKQVSDIVDNVGLIGSSVTLAESHYNSASSLSKPRLWLRCYSGGCRGGSERDSGQSQLAEEAQLGFERQLSVHKWILNVVGWA